MTNCQAYAAKLQTSHCANPWGKLTSGAAQLLKSVIFTIFINEFILIKTSYSVSMVSRQIYVGWHNLLWKHICILLKSAIFFFFFPKCW